MATLARTRDGSSSGPSTSHHRQDDEFPGEGGYLDRLARYCWRHPWHVIVAWSLIVVIAMLTAVGGVIGKPLFDRLTDGALVVPGEGLEGQNLLAQTSDDGPIVMLLLKDPKFRAKFTGGDAQTAGIRFASPDTDRQFDRARAEIRKIPAVKSIGDPFQATRNVYGTASAPYISDDQQRVLMAVTLKNGLDPDVQDVAIENVTKILDTVGPALPGTTALVGGIEELTGEVTHQMEEDLQNGEAVALPISLAIMVVVFSGFLAAGMPIIGALVSIFVAFLMLVGFSMAIDLDPLVVNVVTVLGLGMCIDYGLLLVSRFREEIRDTQGDRRMASFADRELAMRRALSSAGRTILFSGLTVAIALCGLLVFRTPLLQAMGAAGISTILVAIGVALTLVPAMIRLSGTKVLRGGAAARVPGLRRLVKRLGDVSPEEGAFSRLARLVQRFPLIAALSVLGVLFLASVPVLHLRISSSDVALLPQSSEQRQLFESLQADFQYASLPPLEVVASTTPDRVGPLVERLKELPNVYQVDQPREQANDTRSVTVIGLRVYSDRGSGAMADTIHAARELRPGYDVWITGSPVALVDYISDLEHRSVIAIGMVVVATFVLLFLMTGSVLVPLKALLMNVISLGAALGVLVWVFQDGNGEGVLNFTSVAGIETFLLPIVVAFGFGLAMDYEVFLLARIAEAREQGHDNDEAVVVGLQRSGRIITSAALVLIMVYLGLIGGQVLMVKELGVAMVVAVAVDATLVRMILVPATMTMLGEWNWWAPPFLRRLHERFGLRES